MKPALPFAPAPAVAIARDSDIVAVLCLSPPFAEKLAPLPPLPPPLVMIRAVDDGGIDCHRRRYRVLLRQMALLPCRHCSCRYRCCPRKCRGVAAVAGCSGAAGPHRHRHRFNPDSRAGSDAVAGGRAEQAPFVEAGVHTRPRTGGVATVTPEESCRGSTFDGPPPQPKIG